MKYVTAQIKYEMMTENGIEDTTIEYTFDGKDKLGAEIPSPVKKPLADALHMFFKYLLDNDIRFEDFDPSRIAFKTDIYDDDGLRYDIWFYVN